METIGKLKAPDRSAITRPFAEVLFWVGSAAKELGQGREQPHPESQTMKPKPANPNPNPGL